MRRLLLAAALASAAAPGTSAGEIRGFLVFTSSGVSSYGLDGGEPRLRARGEGELEDFAAFGGRLFRVDALLDAVVELTPELAPLREARVPSPAGGPYWLGVLGGFPALLAGNEVVYLDGELKETARRRLSPRRAGDVEPSVAPADFDAWDGRGYLLASTHELFVLGTAGAEGGGLAPALRLDEGDSAQGQWIDPAAGTLNILVNRRREEWSPENRVITQQAVLSYPLDRLSDAPRSAVVYEEREVRVRPDRLGDGPEAGDGRIYELAPAFRRESVTGARIGAMSRTTPAYAEAFRYSEGGGFPEREIVRLGDAGKLETLDVRGESNGGLIWFEVDGERRYLELDLEARELRLLPSPYAALRSAPELRGRHYRALPF